jgi:hypothetical protein
MERRRRPGGVEHACTVSRKSITMGISTPPKIIATRSLPYIVLNDYLKRVQAVVWNRRFLLMEDFQSNTTPRARILGLGPRYTNEGDIICILFGCSVPTILRRSEWPNETYQFIGECFIDERMDGEAIAVAKSEGYNSVSFLLQ